MRKCVCKICARVNVYESGIQSVCVRQSPNTQLLEDSTRPLCYILQDHCYILLLHRAATVPASHPLPPFHLLPTHNKSPLLHPHTPKHSFTQSGSHAFLSKSGSLKYGSVRVRVACVHACFHASVCVCVCVCVSARARGCVGEAAQGALYGNRLCEGIRPTP